MSVLDEIDPIIATWKQGGYTVRLELSDWGVLGKAEDNFRAGLDEDEQAAYDKANDYTLGYADHQAAEAELRSLLEDDELKDLNELQAEGKRLREERLEADANPQNIVSNFFGGLLPEEVGSFNGGALPDDMKPKPEITTPAPGQEFDQDSGLSWQQPKAPSPSGYS